MLAVYAENYYLFQIDQLYKDQSFLQEMMKYNYSCIIEQVAINEVRLGELVKNFFKWIIQKFNDMIQFIKKLFAKVEDKISSNIDTVDKELAFTERMIDRTKEKEFVLKNQRISEMNFVYYESVVKSSDFKNCKNIDIAQRILDMFLDTERNLEQININVPQFVKIVRNQGYGAACSDPLFGLKVSTNHLNRIMQGKSDNDITVEDMKKMIYSSIFLGDKQDKDIVDYGDIKVDRFTITDFKMQSDKIKKCLIDIKNSVSTNEKTLELSKKKMTNIEKRMDEDVVTEELFKYFKLFSDSYIKLFNYNRDILLYLSEISNSQLSYISNIMRKINQYLKGNNVQG